MSTSTTVVFFFLNGSHSLDMIDYLFSLKTLCCRFTV